MVRHCARLERAEQLKAAQVRLSALRHLIEKELGGGHASDLFHGQHEVTKGTGLALARQVRQADAAVAQAQTHILRDGSAFDVNRAFA